MNPSDHLPGRKILEAFDFKNKKFYCALIFGLLFFRNCSQDGNNLERSLWQIRFLTNTSVLSQCCLLSCSRGSFASCLSSMTNHILLHAWNSRLRSWTTNALLWCSHFLVVVIWKHFGCRLVLHGTSRRLVTLAAAWTTMLNFLVTSWQFWYSRLVMNGRFWIHSTHWWLRSFSWSFNCFTTRFASELLDCNGFGSACSHLSGHHNVTSRICSWKEKTEIKTWKLLPIASWFDLLISMSIATCITTISWFIALISAGLSRTLDILFTQQTELFRKIEGMTSDLKQRSKRNEKEFLSFQELKEKLTAI